MLVLYPWRKTQDYRQEMLKAKNWDEEKSTQRQQWQCSLIRLCGADMREIMDKWRNYHSGHGRNRLEMLGEMGLNGILSSANTVERMTHSSSPGILLVAKDL